MSAEVYGQSLCEDERPETMASCTEESDLSAESATSINMHKNPSGVGAPISQMRRLRLCITSVVSEKVTKEE